MKVNNKLKSYFEFINLPDSINSNFVMTDLEKVIYKSNSIDLYEEEIITKEIINIIKSFESNRDISFIIKNKETCPIVEKDRIKYAAQVYLPIYLNNKIEGMAIFFRTEGNYIKSSLKPLITIKKFIEIILERY